jgi:hypothetical protein
LSLTPEHSTRSEVLSTRRDAFNALRGDIMPLTDTAIRSLKPGEKPYKVFDERGLFFL